jgi:hypothetical protein
MWMTNELIIGFVLANLNDVRQLLQLERLNEVTILYLPIFIDQTTHALMFILIPSREIVQN